MGKMPNFDLLELFEPFTFLYFLKIFFNISTGTCSSFFFCSEEGQLHLHLIRFTLFSQADLWTSGCCLWDMVSDATMSAQRDVVSWYSKWMYRRNTMRCDSEQKDGECQSVGKNHHFIHVILCIMTRSHC